MLTADTGKLAAQNWLLKNAGTAAKLFLWTNNALTPTRTTVLADLNMATFGGYAEKDNSVFGVPAINGDGNSESDVDVQTFTAAGLGSPQTTYGMGIKIKDTGGTYVLFAVHKFAQPQTVTVNGDVVTFSLKDYIANLAL